MSQIVCLKIFFIAAIFQLRRVVALFVLAITNAIPQKSNAIIARTISFPPNV